MKSYSVATLRLFSYTHIKTEHQATYRRQEDIETTEPIVVPEAWTMLIHQTSNEAPRLSPSGTGATLTLITTQKLLWKMESGYQQGIATDLNDG